jgi:hypothetical protein
VARLAQRLRYADIRAAGGVTGLLLGADAAEKTGDSALAQELWRRLLDDPAHKVDAQRALDRLTRRLPARANVESAAPAEVDRPATSESR